MKRKILLVILCSLAFTGFAQTSLEDYFNLCIEFGAPLEVVELFQPFRTYKGENNGSVSYVAREDFSLLRDKPFSEYQIWYTIDKTEGLYQSTLILRGDKPILQNTLTNYLRRFSSQFGEPVYTNLDNGSLLIFWYDEISFTVKARLILDVVNAYKFISITFCSPHKRHAQLLKTLYNMTPDGEAEPLKIPVEVKETDTVKEEDSSDDVSEDSETEAAEPDSETSEE
jgi:hypothetical protein